MKLLRAVIVTNPGTPAEGPILDARAFTGILKFDIFDVDFDAQKITAKWGLVDVMDMVSREAYKADFGIWFVS